MELSRDHAPEEVPLAEVPQPEPIQESLPSYDRLVLQTLGEKADCFKVLSPVLATRLDISPSRGISQDYFNLFYRLTLPFDEDSPVEYRQNAVARVAQYIGAFPSYREHVAHLIEQVGLDVSVDDTIREAKEHGIDTAVFDRIIQKIKDVGLQPSDRVGSPETDDKIFQLRLWVCLAGEVIYGWTEQDPWPRRVLHVSQEAMRGLHSQYDASIFKAAA